MSRATALAAELCDCVLRWTLVSVALLGAVACLFAYFNIGRALVLALVGDGP